MHYNKFPNLEVYHANFPNLKGPRPPSQNWKKIPGIFKIAKFCFYIASPKKLLHSTKDETYRQGCHELTGMSQLAEQVVRYDLDDLDVCWLQRVNEEREEIGKARIFLY